METNPNAGFPVFVSGQYLTSEHLNELQSFLWQQEKDSRSFISGHGVIGGMIPGFEDNSKLLKVRLTAGAASTVDGYLVIADPEFIAEHINSASSLDEYAVRTTDIFFDKALGITLNSVVKDNARQLREIKNLELTEGGLPEAGNFEAIELYPEIAKIEDLPNGAKSLESFNITAAQAAANYVMFAWVFVEEAENDHCQQGDCNTKGIQRSYITRYFLVEAPTFAELNKDNEGNMGLSAIETCSVARISKLSVLGGSVDGIKSTAKDAWNISYNNLLPYFDPGNLSTIASLVDEGAAFAQAVNKFDEIKKAVIDSKFPQYYNLFAGDLAKAINELVGFYNDYAEKYPIIYRDRIERVVVLGSLNLIGVDKWRYYFIPMTTQTQLVADKRKLRKLFLRITSLVNNFIFHEGDLAKNKVRAIPTLVGDALLQDRAIPFYYSLNSGDVQRYWNPQDGNLKNISCYYDAGIDNKLSATDWYNINFFRIEGHVGMTLAAAKAAIAALITNDGLPIQLLDCNVNYKGPQKWIKWHGDFSKLLTDSVKALRNDPNIKKYSFDPLKKISTYTLETSYRKPDDVKVLLNDLTAYSGVFYNAKFGVSTPKGKKGLKAGVGAAAANSPITKEVATAYMNQISKTKLTNFVKDYNDAIVDLKDPQTKNLIILKDLAGLEYMGGAVKGGSFVLLHDGTTVIGDGCLPYFYRVDQGRVFSQ